VVFGDNAVVKPVFAAGDTTGEVGYVAEPDKGWGGSDCCSDGGSD